MFVVDTSHDIECTTGTHVALMVLSVVSAVVYLFMSFRFLLVGNDVRHINVVSLTNLYRPWNWSADRFRSLRCHPLYPIIADHMFYMSLMKLFISAVAVVLSRIVDYPPAAAFLYVAAFTLRLFLTMACMPYSNTEFPLDTLVEDEVDPGEAERLDIIEAMQKMKAYVEKMEAKKKRLLAELASEKQRTAHVSPYPPGSKERVRHALHRRVSCVQCVAMRGAASWSFCSRDAVPYMAYPLAASCCVAAA